MPKVSILVPVYNVDKYLGQCLDSLTSQTLQEIEIICINDGSADNSTQILEDYRKRDERIKVINKENSGYGASMNIGLKNASGEYIGIVESDDFVKHTMFEDLYKIAAQNELDIVKSDFYYYTTTDNLARKAGKIPRYKSNRIFNVKDFPEVLKIQPSIWSSLYKKDFLIKNNIRFLETPGASYQDTSFAFKALSLAQRIILTTESYVYYRLDNECSSINSKTNAFAICEEYKEITNFLDKNQTIKTLVNSVKLTNQFNAYKWNLIRIDNDLKDSFIDRFKEEFKNFYDKNEISTEFFKKINKKEFKNLLYDKISYRKYIDCITRAKLRNFKRQKRFSFRINSTRISIILFGKKIVEVG